MKWVLAKPDTKKMVCGWLALEDLEDFFRLCQGDRDVDERRLAYWLRFKEQIGFSQIVLGSGIFWSSDPDHRAFRERKKGRLAQLTGTTSDNNAILMQIGDWVFVDFSQKGNACYPYRTEYLPFEAGSTTYDLYRLKSEKAVEVSKAKRLTHMADWELKFDSSLANWGIWPDEKDRLAKRKPRTEPQKPAAPFVDKQSLLNERAPWMKEFASPLVKAIMAAESRVEDLRTKGGCLWVYPSQTNETLEKQLLRAGFRLKRGRGFYFE